MPNHLDQYLEFYKSCPTPGYAVLVTGAWGSGKTYQVKQALKEKERYYVSLFGLQTVEEISSTVFAAMFPGKALVAAAAKAISGASAGFGAGVSIGVGGLPAGIANAFIKKELKTDRVLIFDDLERSTLPLKETLGAINWYVEHHGCRVVVIAHEEKIDSGFDETKEKIFGQTIRIQPQTEDAFEKFCTDFPKSRLFLEKHRTEILAAFRTSGEQSLRILRHLVEDFSRLREALTAKHLAHGSAMTELIRLFSALNIEARCRRLKPNDMKGRLYARTAGLMARSAAKGSTEVAQSRLVLACERYNAIDLTSELISDDVLIQTLFNGHYDAPGIQSCLNNSAYFLKQETAAPWKIFIQFDRFDDGTISDAMQKLNAQFEQRDVTESGEMLHLFALRLMMAHHALVNQDIQSATRDCISYIDDLVASGRLPVRELGWRWTEPFSGAYGGFGYYVLNEYKLEFEQIFDHLVSSRTGVLTSKFPELSSALLRDVESDGERFFEQVCETKGMACPFALIPILASIPPNDFVTAWMRSHPKHWYWIQGALNERYRGAALRSDLRDEAPWLAGVIENLKQRAASATGIARLRIERTVPHKAEAALNELTP